MGQPLGLLGDPLAREALDGLGDAGVQCTLPVLKQSVAGDLLWERVLEGVLEVRKKADLIVELRGMQAGELGTHLVFRRVGNGEQQWQRNILADDRGGL